MENKGKKLYLENMHLDITPDQQFVLQKQMYLQMSKKDKLKELIE